ncbi:hypothetical protein BpHYR1_044389 [Brachionus plicatilis]|uniref:Uncharacterized protein n=1 Tax=Brachionus plicatilis TaxID=10195 RepID=A0A3M7SVJ4_BRAPC|nr:hypothetical protein BpHYR1_044389 [Brachionus plicatilis]
MIVLKKIFYSCGSVHNLTYENYHWQNLSVDTIIRIRQIYINYLEANQTLSSHKDGSVWLTIKYFFFDTLQ